MATPGDMAYTRTGTLVKTGVVDENGILWKATGTPGKFSEPFKGCTNLYSTLTKSCAEMGTAPAAGMRSVVVDTIVGGFQKLKMGPYSWTSYFQYQNIVDAFGAGLKKQLPISKGDTIVIYAETQERWMQAAYGAWRQGLVVGTIYATLGEEGALYGINQSKCKAVVADGKLLKILAKIATKFTTLKDIVLISEPDEASAKALAAAGITVHKMDDLIALGKEQPCQPELADKDDTAVLMYTSGTTGNPKGVLISHHSILVVIGGTASKGSATSNKGKPYIKKGAVYLAYLPLAHIMELAIEITMFAMGTKVGYGNPGTLTPTGVKMLQPGEHPEVTKPQVGDAATLRPTIFVAAPAVLDKVFVAVKGKFAALSGWKARNAQAGLVHGKEVYAAGGVGTKGLLAKLIFKKVKGLLGGKVEVMLTGSAPLSADVQMFMQSVFGCPVRQGYGLTETCAASCIAVSEDNTTYQVGPPQESACIRLRDWEEGNYTAADEKDPKIGFRRGEVLIGGPTVCSGYLVDKDSPDPEIVEKNNTEFTVIDGIRYFCTGDIGQFTAAGNLMIIDRKKDLCKLKMGEYVALSKVENVCKGSQYTQLPMVHAVSTEDHCILCLCPAIANLKQLAVSMGKGDQKLGEWCADPAIIEAVLADIVTTCKAGNLAKFEIPKKLILIEEEWTPENDMLTAVRKLKRKEIVGRHAKEINGIGYPVKI